MKLSAVIIRFALNTMVAAAIAFAIAGSSNYCAAATSTQDTNNDRNDDESTFIRLNNSFFLGVFFLVALPLFSHPNCLRMMVDLAGHVERRVERRDGRLVDLIVIFTMLFLVTVTIVFSKIVDFAVHVGRRVGRLVRGWLGERVEGRVVAALEAPVGNVLQVGTVAIKLPNRAEVSHDTITNIIGEECIICNVHKKICVTWPCAHISYCVGCALLVGCRQDGNTPKNIGQLQCSLCQEIITDIKRVFG